MLFKLDKRRHFRFVEDQLSFADKKDAAVFRGAVTQPHRIRFMQEMFDHPLVDAGQSNSSDEHPEWQKPFMSVEEQLQYKFLICLEGNDVASNLKWAMSSNSVVVTPKMKFETWFMEGTLQAGVHYIEVKDDWSDFEEKIQYYIDNPLEAEKIVKNAHDYIAPFKDEKLEQLVCIKTLERYFELSGQLEKK
ncbi:putative lipopolysaccharide A protein [Vibrio orientalis CIP 102891 = ATCC 33934]|uniref:Lipopolysaccharide A protein n=1 Tax=Vibrio orientalis CIP 102891 = ATCC 33934 TaxID=675816 RepID=A0ABP2H8B4_VIBOR|nr:putative lipopolysaccharide A protein [Vibrio orientalis CIP 102891 = ATCC 33934]